MLNSMTGRKQAENMRAMNKKHACLEYIRDDQILPSYMGIIINYHEDPC